MTEQPPDAFSILTHPAGRPCVIVPNMVEMEGKCWPLRPSIIFRSLTITKPKYHNAPVSPESVSWLFQFSMPGLTPGELICDIKTAKTPYFPSRPTPGNYAHRYLARQQIPISIRRWYVKLYATFPAPATPLRRHSAMTVPRHMANPLAKAAQHTPFIAIRSCGAILNSPRFVRGKNGTSMGGNPLGVISATAPLFSQPHLLYCSPVLNSPDLFRRRSRPIGTQLSTARLL